MCECVTSETDRNKSNGTLTTKQAETQLLSWRNWNSLPPCSSSFEHKDIKQPLHTVTLQLPDLMRCLDVPSNVCARHHVTTWACRAGLDSPHPPLSWDTTHTHISAYCTYTMCVKHTRIKRSGSTFTFGMSNVSLEFDFCCKFSWVSVELWAVCSFNDARLASFYQSVTFVHSAVHEICARTLHECC